MLTVSRTPRSPPCGFALLQLPPWDVLPSLRRRCRGVAAGIPLSKVVGAADSLDVRRPNGSNVSVAVSSFVSPGATVGVAMGDY